MGLGAVLGEIPAARRGYDGKREAGMTEVGRGSGGEVVVWGWVQLAARYPRQGAGMTVVGPIRRSAAAQRIERPCERALVGSSGLWSCERCWV